MSYGYTDARFVKFFNGKTDYAHKHVPYAPQQTLFAGLTYNLPLSGWVDNIEFNANVRGVGPIYWNEDNASRQNFYLLPGASVTVMHRDVSLSVWGENLSDTRYNVFSFRSIGNEFVQRGLPVRYGVTLRVNFETGKPF